MPPSGGLLLLAGGLVVLAGGCDAGPAPLREPEAPAASGAAVEPDPPPDSVRALIVRLRGEPEAAAVRAAGPSVVRPRVDRLVIVPAAGEPVVLADRWSDDEVHTVYAFRDRIEPIGGYLVEVIHHPEGGAFLLVDERTGRPTEVDARPVPSPDGERFITASLDLVAGHRPNRIRIYRIGAAGPEPEWSLEPREWGATHPEWIDDRRIELRRAVVDWSTQPIHFRFTAMRVELGPDGWRVVIPRTANPRSSTPPRNRRTFAGAASAAR